VGCHTLSRDGKRLAVTTGSELRVVSLTDGGSVTTGVGGASAGTGGTGGAAPMKGDKAMPSRARGPRSPPMAVGCWWQRAER
jgi:hypothetical protein